MDPEFRRRQLGDTLRTAFSEGLLSESTFVTRLDRVLGAATIDPHRVIGDLTLGEPRGPGARARRLSTRIALWPRRQALPLLALDWSGASPERLIVGRDPESDIVLEEPSVSRRHAELLWRGGAWVLHDLGSRHGTALNGAIVTRARLRPGDYVAFASRTLRVD